MDEGDAAMARIAELRAQLDEILEHREEVLSRLTQEEGLRLLELLRGIAARQARGDGPTLN